MHAYDHICQQQVVRLQIRRTSSVYTVAETADDASIDALHEDNIYTQATYKLSKGP
jgi:hypothetical protein